MGQKSKIFLTIFLAIFGVTAWLQFFYENNATKNTLQQSLESEITRDSAYIADHLSDILKKEVLDKLSTSTFGIEIYNENVLVWWNDIARLTPKIKDARYLVFDYQNLDVVIRTELTEFGKTHLTFFSNDHPAENQKLNFRGLEYTYKDSPSSVSSFISLSWIVLWFCLLVFIRTYTSKTGKAQWSKYLLPTYILLSRIFFSCTFCLGDLNEIFLTKPFAENCLLFSPLTFSLDTLLLWVGMYALIEKKRKKLAVKTAWLQPVMAAFFLGAFFIYWNAIIRQMVLSNRIFVDVADILFFNAASVWVVVFFIFNLIAGFNIIQALFARTHSKDVTFSGKYLYYLLGLAAILPVYYVSDLWVNPIIYTLFLLAMVLIFDVYSEIKEQKLTYMLWWMLLFSGYLAIGFFHYDQIKSEKNRTAVLENHFFSASSTDMTKAREVKQTLDTSAIFLQLGNLEYPAKWDKDEIIELFSGVLSMPLTQFDVELFDRNGFSLFSNHFGNYHQLKKSLQIGRPLEGNNLIFHPLRNEYFIQYEILPAKHPDGPWMFVLSMHSQHKTITQSSDLSYALLKNGRVAEKKFKTNELPSDDELMKVKSSGIHGNYVYSFRENNMGYTMLVFEPKPGLLKPISIFSLLFTCMGLVFILLTWLNTKRPFLPKTMPLKLGIRSSLKTRIQLSIILLIIFSFIVVGAVTAFYFHNLIQANQSSKEREETQILANSVVQESRQLEGEQQLLGYFYKNLLNLSYIHGKNLQLYDAQGKLLATSISDPMEYLLPYQDVNGFQRNNDGDKNHKRDEHFDYIELIDLAGKKSGYLGIQHQHSDISSRSIVNFLGTILNVYIFLFLIGGVIAITIANSITQPIAILAEKLKAFKLGKSNEYLEWQSNDEIGVLISEYNNLNVALNRSAEMLAKTERDMAWREMAKQVAHEIKNPLTPMKLSIQYLEKTAKEDPERAKEMIPRVSNTLIEQIDNLSQIAVEFSNFAAMPQANNEKVALNDLVVTIHDLFRKRDDMDITMSMPIDDLVVFADKNHLVRILNNLVKNAIQAIPDGRRGKIDITLSKEQNHAIIQVTDNGSGIPEAMKTKVFAPNFTTKSSGTGLGLAISANMIESFNGKIYFESEENHGTRFYIRIPLMKIEESTGDLRVSLDDDVE